MVFCLHVCIFLKCVPDALRDQKKTSDFLELGLQTPHRVPWCLSLLLQKVE